MRGAAVWASTFVSEVGTVCVSSASTGLCGGYRVTGIPTATPLFESQLAFDQGQSSTVLHSPAHIQHSVKSYEGVTKQA